MVPRSLLTVASQAGAPSGWNLVWSLSGSIAAIPQRTRLACPFESWGMTLGMVSDAGALASAAVILPVLGLWAYGLIDFSRTDERDMRTFPRQTWILILVFGSVFGAIMWLRLGRPERPRARR